MGPKLKVRSGCATCKLRKVKCDEGKPVCHRCKASGRHCDGYQTTGPNTRSIAIRRQNLIKPQGKPDARMRSLLPKLSDEINPHLSIPLELEESKWLHFFSSRTGPALALLPDDHAFWSRNVPRLAITEPAVRHALLAVASFHARFETMHSSLNGSRAAVSGSFTVRNYDLAISELRRTMSTQSENLDVPLTCCLLFVLLECLYGNYPLVMTHLRNGLNILQLPEFDVVTDGEARFVRKKLRQIFSKLLAHSTLFGAPPITPSPEESKNEGLPGAASQEPFDDAVEAKSVLDGIVSLSLNYVKSLHDDTGERRPSGETDDLQLQQSLKDQLIMWELRLVASEGMLPQHIDPDDPTVITLKIQQKATLVYLSRSVDIEESSFDVYRPEFVEILDLYRKFKEKQPRKESAITALLSSTFSVDSAFVPALFLVAYKCRDPVLRREAIALLETLPSREGLWDARLHARIGRRVIELEEGKMLIHEGAGNAAMEKPPSTRMVASNGATMSKWPLERFRIYNIRRTSEDPARAARVTFYAAPEGFDKQTVRWDELIEY